MTLRSACKVTVSLIVGLSCNLQQHRTCTCHLILATCLPRDACMHMRINDSAWRTYHELKQQAAKRRLPLRHSHGNRNVMFHAWYHNWCSLHVVIRSLTRLSRLSRLAVLRAARDAATRQRNFSRFYLNNHICGIENSSLHSILCCPLASRRFELLPIAFVGVSNLGVQGVDRFSK
jgi:hypothetical protein